MKAVLLLCSLSVVLHASTSSADDKLTRETRIKGLLGILNFIRSHLDKFKPAIYAEPKTKADAVANSSEQQRTAEATIKDGLD